MRRRFDWNDGEYVEQARNETQRNDNYKKTKAPEASVAADTAETPRGRRAGESAAATTARRALAALTSAGLGGSRKVVPLPSTPSPISTLTHLIVSWSRAGQVPIGVPSPGDIAAVAASSRRSHEELGDGVWLLPLASCSWW